MLAPGDDTGEDNIDDRADDSDPGRDRELGRKRDMRVFREMRERLDCGVDGGLDVLVVEDTEASERPGVPVEAVVALDFFREERAGGARWEVERWEGS